MIGAALDAGGFRADPIGREGRIDIVAALGRLDIGEVDPGIGQAGPAYLALVMRHIDALARVEQGGGMPVARLCAGQPPKGAADHDGQYEPCQASLRLPFQTCHVCLVSLSEPLALVCSSVVAVVGW